MSPLEDKVAVNSDGTSGVGLAGAGRFVAEGAHVFVFGQCLGVLEEGCSS